MGPRPRGIVKRAAIAIVIVFGVLHIAGARDCVRVLSGTLPASGVELAAGLAYVAAWFGVVLVVPVFALALLFEAGYGRMVARLERWRATQRR